MKAIILLLLLFVSYGATAQNLRERGEVRGGNREFSKENYEGAAEHYTRATEYAPESYEARYNLGSALFKSENYEGAEKLLAELAADSLQSDGNRADAFFNLGNSQFGQQKLEEALESYKNAMRFNPDDVEAKYNYAYTKALLEQQDQNEDQNEDQNQDQNDDQQESDDQQDQGDDQQDQNQDQQEGDDEQNQDDQNQDQNQDQDQGDDQQDQQGQQPQQPEISEQEQQQMLDAIQAQEDKTQDDLKEKMRGVVVPGSKNW